MKRRSSDRLISRRKILLGLAAIVVYGVFHIDIRPVIDTLESRPDQIDSLVDQISR
jgi:hypothetical protein